MKTLFTIGYEGANLVDFIATLQIAGVQNLLDVREIAQSRRAGFSKNALAAALSEAGIRYVHLKQLGDPKPGREAARAGRIEEFRKIFEAHLEQPDTKSAIQEASVLCEQQATVLLCFERNPQLCHRTIVATRLAELCSLSVRHLGVVRDAGGRFKPVRLRRPAGRFSRSLRHKLAFASQRLPFARGAEIAVLQVPIWFMSFARFGNREESPRANQRSSTTQRFIVQTVRGQASRTRV